MSTYYVSTGGNDGNSGSESSPWRNPNLVAARLSAGDTLFHRAGTYSTSFPISSIPSGTSWSNTVRLAAYPGETVWIKPPSGHNRVMEFAGVQQFIEIDGLNLNGEFIGYDVVKINAVAPGNAAHHIRFQNLTALGTLHSQVGANTGSHVFLVTQLAAGLQASNEFRNVVLGRNPGIGDGFSHGFYLQSHDNVVEQFLIDGSLGWDGNAIQMYNGQIGGVNLNNIVRYGTIRHLTSATGRHRGVEIGSTSNGAKVYSVLVYHIVGTPDRTAGIRNGGANSEIYNTTVVDVNRIGISQDGGTNATYRNNIAWNCGFSNYTNNGGSIAASSNNLGASASGWTNVDPQFLNEAGRDYHLSETSPAIDAGITISSIPALDLDGGARPAGSAWDIGAYEFGAFGGSPGSPPGVPVESPPALGSPGSPDVGGSPGASDDIPVGGLTIVTDFYSDHDMQCPESWYGGFKEGRVIRFGDGERAFSHMFTGEWVGASFDLSISDFDRKLREQLNSATNRYWVEPLTIRMTTRANREILGTPYTVFVGPIIAIRPQNPLILDLTLGDIVSQALITDDQQIPWRRIRDGFLNELDSVAEGLDLDAPEPIIYGTHRRVPDIDPASPQGFQVTPIYLGIEGLYHVWMVCGHACKDIPDVIVWTPDEFGGLGTDQTVLIDGDWLIPHTSAPAYEDRRSLTYGNDRRYTLIRGLVGNTDADACATGERTLTCFVDGIEQIGDSTGALITDRLQQYEHFLINFVANRGPLSYQTGIWLTNPAWELFDGNVTIVHEDSFAAAQVIGIERLPAAVSGGEEGYIGAAIIGARPSDRLSVREWIARWNRSCGVSFGINHFGQITVSMLHPTAAIKAAAPLYTDAYEILEGSFSTEVRWMDKANRIPWLADYEYTSGQWKTSDVASDDTAVTRYGQEIQGDVRDYPFAPGETAANHLAQLELRIRTHPRRVVAIDATVGHDYLGDSLGYRDLGSYIRFKHFDAVSADTSEIRLGYVIKHQVQAGTRKVRAIVLDVDDLIGFDAFDAGTTLGTLNDTCANAVVITPGNNVNYTIEINTAAHDSDPTISGLCGSPGGAFNAAWWSYTPEIAQRGHVTTGTSTYDTILSVWTGACGALSLVECNDNDGIFETSFIEFADANFLQAGVTYHFLVTSHGSPGGGALVFTFFAEPL